MLWEKAVATLVLTTCSDLELTFLKDLLEPGFLWISYAEGEFYQPFDW